MDDVFKKALDKMVEDLNSDIEELNRNPLIEIIKAKKRLINDFSVLAGGSKIYPDIESDLVTKEPHNAIYPGQFKGMTLAKAVRIYLNMRGKDNPPKYIEIKEALKMGDFDQKKIADIRNALLKNNQICLLQNDYFGLAEWYGIGKKRSTKDDNGNGNNESNGDDQGETMEESGEALIGDDLTF
jgi:hypothetical protein